MERPLGLGTKREQGTTPGLDTKYLSIYLADHVAGATAGLERVRRMASTYHGTPAGPVLQNLAEQLEEEREFLVTTTRTLGLDVSRSKVALATAAERVGRLKPNGRLLRASPLSALLEVEILRGAIMGKLSGWQTLSALPAGAPVDRERLVELERQAEAQVEQLTELLTRLRPAVARRGGSGS
jgi:hypothetical protein